MTYPAGACTGGGYGPTDTFTYPANHAWAGGTGIFVGDPAAQPPPSTTAVTNGTAPGAATVIRWPVNTPAKKFASDGLMGSQYNIGINGAHTGGANTLRCDGSVFFLRESTAYNVLMLMAIIDDGQVLQDAS